MKIYRKLISVFCVSVLLLVSLSVTCFALEVPTKPEDFCLDDGNMLSTGTEKDINERNTQLKEKNAEVFVVTVDDLGDESIYDFGKKLYSKWGIGGEIYNGILLLINKNTSGLAVDYYAFAGDGLNKYFGDEKLKSIVKTYLEPQFYDEKYDLAIDGFMKAVTEKITGEESLVGQEATETEDKTEEQGQGFDFVAIIGAIFQFIITAIIVLAVIILVALVLLNIRAKRIKQRRREARMKAKRQQKNSQE